MINLFPDITIVYQWLNFIAAVLVLHYGIFKPVLKVLEERHLRTIGERDNARLLTDKSEGILKTCEKRLEEARLAGSRKTEEVRAQAGQQAEEILKKARQDVERRREEVRQKIDHSVKECSLQLKQHARELGREMASKILEREVA